MLKSMFLMLSFCASGLVAQNYYKQLVKSVEVPLSVSDAFAMWATAEGVQSFLCEKANIGQKPGEAYEIFFSMDLPEGERGNEGGVITQYWENQKLGFTWNLPPSMASLRQAGEKTEVFVVFAPEEGQMTKVTLGHIGWKEGAEWDQAYDYFDNAWTAVLKAYETAAWKKAMEPFAFLEGTWQQQDQQNLFLRFTFGNRIIEGESYESVNGSDQTKETFQIALMENGWSYVPYTITSEGDKVGLGLFLLVKHNEGLVQFYNGDGPFPEDVFYTAEGEAGIAVRMTGEINGNSQEIIRQYTRVE